MSYTQTILSAAKREDIVAYFQNQIKSTKSSCHFPFSSEVTVDLLNSRPNPTAPIIIHTPIVFSGPKEQVEKTLADFRMKFLTAGG